MTSPQRRKSETAFARAIATELLQGVKPGEPARVHASQRQLMHFQRPSAMPKSEAEGEGWKFLGYLSNKKELPQWRTNMSDHDLVVGLVVGGVTGIRSVYVRADHVRIAPDGLVHNDPQFVMLLEPRTLRPLSGWRSA